MARVLVVEDNDGLRELAADILEAGGHEVICAENGCCALEILSQDSAVEVLFTDIVMPCLNGFELARMVRMTWPEINVLYTSGFTTNLLLDGRSIVPGKMLQKPYRPSSLLAEIERLAESPPERASLDGHRPEVCLSAEER